MRVEGYTPVGCWYAHAPMDDPFPFEEGEVRLYHVPTPGGAVFTLVLRPGADEEARRKWALVDGWVAAGLSWPEAVELVWFDGAGDTALALEEEE